MARWSGGTSLPDASLLAGSDCWLSVIFFKYSNLFAALCHKQADNQVFPDHRPEGILSVKNILDIFIGFWIGAEPVFSTRPFKAHEYQYDQSTDEWNEIQ